MNDVAKECYVQLERCRKLLSEYRAELKTCTDSKRKSELKMKIKSLRGSVEDLKIQIKHFDPDSELNTKQYSKGLSSLDAFQYDFFERTTVTWSDIEGHTWSQLEAGDFVEVSRKEYDTAIEEINNDVELMQKWMKESAAALTTKQRIYLDMYYNDGLSLAMIAEEFGVVPSTVSQTIKRGLKNMQSWIDSKKLANECEKAELKFDWVSFLQKVPVLSDRQRELMMILMSRMPRDQIDIADRLGITRSTVSRTLMYAAKKLKKLQVFGKEPNRKFKFTNWEDADKYTIAVETGMPLNFYYKSCFRGQKVNGITRYMYELFRRHELGMSYEQIADEMGVSTESVKINIRKLKKTITSVANYKVPNSDTIGAKLDPETYLKLQKLVTANNAIS